MSEINENFKSYPGETFGIGDETVNAILTKADAMKAEAKAIIIDPEFENLIPPLTEDEYQRLEESILREGCRDPLIVWNNILVDGHNRYSICTRNDIEYKTINYRFNDRDEVKLWIMRNQLARRNLTEIQRIKLVTWCEAALKKEAEQRKLATLKQNFTVRENLPVRTRATEELGKLAGVSRKTYEHATKAMREAPASVIEALNNNEISIDAAYAVTKMNEEEKKEVLERINEGEAAKTVVSEIRNRPHVANNSGNNEWYTPIEYIELAKQVMGGIDLDPASNDKANEVIGATQYYTVEDNGLDHDWYGNIWLNPPYSSDLIGKFVNKLIEELWRIDNAIVLVNNATETEWFNSLVQESSVICFTKGRVKFWAPDGRIAQPLQGQAILYFGKNTKGFIDAFSTKGWCTYPA